ncbi:hypothetical protein A5647_24880 [Mycobacterium sp. 1100029.7]|nr:hypothetical protein A5647_24880 [Mycobacterium sp. 1100029.7]
MSRELTTAEIVERVATPAFYDRGVGALITGPSREGRSTISKRVQHQYFERGYDCLSVTLFELVGGFHFGQSEQLCSRPALFINDLGSLSQAEQNAIDLMRPCLSVTAILEAVLDSRLQWERPTLVTTEHELPKLAALFSPRFASLVGAVGFSIELDAENEARRVD